MANCFSGSELPRNEPSQSPQLPLTFSHPDWFYYPHVTHIDECSPFISNISAVRVP